MPITDRVLQLRQEHADFHGSIRGLSAKALREKKPALVGEIRKLSDLINADAREFTAEETERWTLVNEHYDILEAQIEQSEDPLYPPNHRERLAILEQSNRAPVHPPVGRADHVPTRGLAGLGDDGAAVMGDNLRSLALQAWCKAQFGEWLDEPELDACRTLRFNPQASQIRMPLLPTDQLRQLQDTFATHHPSRAKQAMRGVDFRATLSQQVGPTGAYLVPPETLIRQLEINMLYYGGMRQVAETMTTTTGERMSWPTVDDTTNKGVQLGESLAAMPPGQASVDPTFSKIFWDAYKFSSLPVLVPYELLQDSAFKLPELLGELLGIRLGRITNTKYTLGTGAATPKGLVQACTTSVTSAIFSAISHTAIFWDDIFGLIHSIDPAYRTADCGFMCHDQVILAVRKLKSGTGEYLWQPGLELGVPDRVLGYRYTVNQDMDSTFATGKNTLLFGQLFKYKIRRVGEMRLYRLEERYRDTDQDGFVALIREDGNLLTGGTPPVKVLQQ
jgi:HK97 family phage major capsid protein